MLTSQKTLRLAGILLFANTLTAQTKPEPDTLLLNDGEKLIGHLVSSSGGTVRFKSDVLGEVNIDWSKVKELHAAGQYAVIPKDERLGRHPSVAGISEGTVTETDQKIEVAGAGGNKTFPVGDVGQLIDAPSFHKAIEGGKSFFRDWRGTATLGASLVEATQNTRSVNDSISLTRIEPNDGWLERRNRTAVDFSSSYGVISQPNTPTVRSSILHADAERDEYFSPATYVFAQAQFDHNYSQGLDLQQTYSGGIGFSVIKRPNASLDLKAAVSFIDQSLSGSTSSNELVGSVFDEKYVRKFFRGSTFTEEIAVSPTWNQTSALSALANASLAMPINKKFSFTLGVIENFLNDPAPGFKKNSIQYITGLTFNLN